MRAKTGWIMLLAALAILACQGPAREEAKKTGSEPPPVRPRAAITGEIRLTGREDAGGIQVYIPGTSLISITDRAGRYLLSDVAPGDYEIHARAEGYQGGLVGHVTVTAADHETQYSLATATLEPNVTPRPTAAETPLPGSIRGKLVADTEEPIDWSPATIELEATPYRTAAAADGSFLLWSLPPGQYQLVARLPGYEPGRERVRVLPGPQATTATVVMLTAEMAGDGRPYLFIASSTPAAGRGAPGAGAAPTTATTARIHGTALKNVEGQADMSGISIALAGTTLVAMTDAEGRYGIEGIRPGTYRLLAQAEGFLPAELNIELQGGQDAELDEIRLEPRRTYPMVIGTTPTGGARKVTIVPEIPILVRFNKKMNPDSLRQAVRVEPEVAFRVFAGREQSDTDYDLMKVVLYGAGLKPVARFRTRYTLTVNEAATDVEGLKMQKPYRMSVTTGDPEVIRTMPANGAAQVGLAPQTPVELYFNAPVDYRSVTQESLTILPQPDTNPLLALRDDNTTGWTRLSITAMWRPDTEYRVTLLRRVRTATNQPITNTPYTFRFRTGKLVVPSVPQPPQGAH